MDQRFEVMQQAWPETNRDTLARVSNWISIAGGGGLAAYGISRRSLGGAALAAAGGFLIYDGVKGVRSGGRLELECVSVDRAETINRSADELYRYWRNFENHPNFMNHLESVRQLDNRRSHWTTRGPMGRKMEWDAEIVDERDNEFIEWRSLPGSDVSHTGHVSFHQRPDGRGTVVKVHVEYRPVGGRIGRALGMLFGADPEQQFRENLRQFKQLMEAGEIPTTAGQPTGRRGPKGALLEFMFHERPPIMRRRAG